jgi:hypothetical protein
MPAQRVRQGRRTACSAASAGGAPSAAGPAVVPSSRSRFPRGVCAGSPCRVAKLWFTPAKRLVFQANRSFETLHPPDGDNSTADVNRCATAAVRRRELLGGLIPCVPTSGVIGFAHPTPSDYLLAVCHMVDARAGIGLARSTSNKHGPCDDLMKARPKLGLPCKQARLGRRPNLRTRHLRNWPEIT